MVKFSSRLLEQFIAPEISSLSENGIILVEDAKNYFGSFFLNQLLTGFKYEAKARVFLGLFIRRVKFACEELKLSRDSLQIFIEELPRTNTNLSSLYYAIHHLESCIMHTHTAIGLLQTFGRTLNIPRMCQKNDGSDYDRLVRMSNRIKHFNDDLLALTDIEDLVSSPIWLTNKSIRCRDKCGVFELEFKELHDILECALRDAKAFSEDIPREIMQRRRDKAS